MRIIDVSVPFVVLDDLEYTLLTDDEVADRSVTEEIMRERAEDLTPESLRLAGLLGDDETELAISDARDKACAMNSARSKAELQEHRAVLEACSRGGVEVVVGKYTLNMPSPEQLANARQAATSGPALDLAFYHANLAAACFVRGQRPSGEVKLDELPVPCREKLGAVLHDRSTLGEARLSFALRRHARSLTAAECPTASPSGQS